MQSDCLEADEVVSAWHLRGDRSRPAAVLRNHLTGSPESLLDSAADEPKLIDLELSMKKERQKMV